jgi:hypothetical protein
VWGGLGPYGPPWYPSLPGIDDFLGKIVSWKYHPLKDMDGLHYKYSVLV